jgi:hypothetical protein
MLKVEFDLGNLRTCEFLLNLACDIRRYLIHIMKGVVHAKKIELHCILFCLIPMIVVIDMKIMILEETSDFMISFDIAKKALGYRLIASCAYHTN